MPAITNHMPTAELQALDHAHHMHPFSMHEGFATKGARVITRGDGVWLTDSEGEQILDAMAGLWCVNIGYGRGELADVAARQMRRFGGMVSFVLEGSVEDGMAFCTRTKIFACAESLGGVESLIEHPPSMTHAAVPAEVRRAAGLDDGLLRLSVGIEDIADLLADLEQALA